MPVKPQPTKAVEKTATSVEIMNTIRDEIGGDYASAVPYAEPTTQSIREIGQTIMSMQTHQNNFLNALINRIAFVRITSRLYENPWAGFKKGLMEMGETVEEVFVNLAKPFQFDPEEAESNVFKREIPDVRAAFHTMNYQKFYKVTVSNDELRQAFLSWNGVTDLISKIIESLYTGANYDEFLVMKYMIARLSLDGFVYPTAIADVSEANAKGIVTTIKENVNNFRFMSTKYNYSGVTTYTDPSSLYVIVNSKFDALMDVEVLAAAFNMDKAEFLGRRILTDSFSNLDDARLAVLFADDPSYQPLTTDEKTKLDSIPAFMCDENWFMIFDNYYGMKEQYNGEGLYWNYWYHVWKTFSASPFANATLFTSSTNSVTGVTISPATATVSKNGSLQMSATVATTGFASKGVAWTVAGGSSATISGSGVLKVPGNETATSLTVTATSLYDSTKKGTATITVG